MSVKSGLKGGRVTFEGKRSIRHSASSTAQTLLFSSLFKGVLRTQRPCMVDPRIDEEPGPFSYFSKPSFQMGLPGEKLATQVTPEGHLFTGAAELEFFAGPDLEPVSQRIRTLYRGWLPCVIYNFENSGAAYRIEAFQYWLAEEYSSLPVIFIRITARNPGDDPVRAKLAVGFEFGGSDHRPAGMRKDVDFNPAWIYEMTDDGACRGDKIVYLWDEKPSNRWREQGKEYSEPFRCTKKQKPVCIVSYSLELLPGKEKSYTFKMPFRPLPLSGKEEAQALASARFDDYLSKMESFWEALLSPGMDVIVSEDKVTSASKAYRVHNFMCQNIVSEEEIEQVVNRFQYNRFWLRDNYFFTKMYDEWNFPGTAEKALRHFLGYQTEDGNFLSQPGQLDGFGQSLAAFGNHVKMTKDAAFAKEVFPAVDRAVGWLEDRLSKDVYGLMPPTSAMDNEAIIGRYAGHNFWALMGLDGAIEVAKAAGRSDAAQGYEDLRNDYYKHFMAQLRKASRKNKGVMPPGMDTPDGIDWGNLLAVYPGNLVDPFDPLITETFKHYRENHMQEGISTYASCLHHYLTERVAQTALIRGEQELVIKDFYAMLTHTGSCHEGFEFLIYPWSDRDYCLGLGELQICNFTPHGWYAAVFNTLLRMMFVREQGRELHLLSAVSPEWVKPGDKIKVERAATCFGKIDIHAGAHEGGMHISIDPDWKDPPQAVILHLPFFANVSEVTVNGARAQVQEDSVKLPAKSCEIKISWTLDPSINYSYDRAVEDFKAEYRRRYSKGR